MREIETVLNQHEAVQDAVVLAREDRPGETQIHELGKHVLLAVDSLTGLWAAMLEVEEADAQLEADRAGARRTARKGRSG